jgi:2-polyprenyl-6-hydroxyphenyl methylase/3-demethylubiquinone-9 3-methyltransferase
MRLETRHLSTDRFLSRQQLGRLLSIAGLHVRHLDHWTFIPRGDMPPLCGMLLGILDWFCRSVAPDALRGGLVVSAEKGRSEPGKDSHEINGDYGAPG